MHIKIANYILITLFALCGLSSCIEDGITTSPADQPAFSVDTLKMGVVYTDENSATHKLTVYNPHDKGLNLSSVMITGENAPKFRLNVDGMSGKEFHDVEIRANDSIFVFVSTDLPATGRYEPVATEANLDFMVNGMTSTVVIRAEGQDITRIKAQVLEEDTRLTADRKYQVKDSLVVPEGVTLTIDPGAIVMFHDRAHLLVRGTLIAEGTAEQPILLTGDRTGNVITDVSFDLMSRQWGGVEFAPTSTGNMVAYTEISNTSYGVVVEGTGEYSDTKQVTFINSRLRNSGGSALQLIGASVAAYGCEIADAATSPLIVMGGDSRFDQCTLANYYLFVYPNKANISIIDPADTDDYKDYPPTRLLMTNSISYGLSKDVTPGEFETTDVIFNRCLFKSKGDDDPNFIDSLWDSDPLFYAVRNEYILDYRLKPESPAIDAAYTALSDYPLKDDYYGQPRRADLGAYVYMEPLEEE